jgi:signal transduction histidine kinase
VYSRNRKDKINFSFFILTISITMWGISMVAYRGLLDHDAVVWMGRLLYFSAITIPTAFIYFCFIFPDPNMKLSAYQKYLAPIPMIIMCTISLIPGLFVYDVILYPNRESFMVFNKIGEIMFIIYVVSYFSWAYWIIFKKYLKATGTLKTQLVYIFFGTFSSTMITLITNMTLLYFGDFDYNWVGQVGIIIMISLIFYSILKYRLFNIRVIATELFVFALWAFILVRTFLSTDTQDQLADIGLFIITVAVGILLIRSVIKEVNLREKVEKLATDLEKANENQVALIHFITHQVKGFFTKSRDIFSILLEGDAGNIPDQAKNFVRQGFDSDTKGVAMVQDVLTAANVRSGIVKYTMEPFDLQTLVSALVIEYKPEALGKGLTLTFEVVAPAGANAGKSATYRVAGDQEQLKQVFKNLIENSIKYTPAGTVAVSLSHRGEKTGDKSDSISGDMVLFAVKDSGVGISPDDKKLLFTQGGRGKDSVKVNVESTGYGLYIAKGIVEAHHGTIWAESEGSSKGSQFYVQLPAVN